VYACVSCTSTLHTPLGSGRDVALDTLRSHSTWYKNEAGEEEKREEKERSRRRKRRKQKGNGDGEYQGDGKSGAGPIFLLVESCLR